MTDFLVTKIPLPIPRPEMEEVHPVLEVGEKLNFPLPDINELDLSYPLVGLDWVLYPWTLLKGKTLNFINELHSQLNTGYTEYSSPDRWTDVLIFFAALGFLSGVIIVSWYVLKELGYTIRYLWNKFHG